MALSATVIPQIEDALRSFMHMHDPMVERSLVNHCNIHLAAKVCNFKRAESKQSVSLDSRDFNNFADLVKDLIMDHIYRFCLSCGSYCFSIKRPGHTGYWLLWQNERIRKERGLL